MALLNLSDTAAYLRLRRLVDVYKRQGYSGVLDNAGDFVGSMEQGLPEPGYHIDLPDSVEALSLIHI